MALRQTAASRGEKRGGGTAGAKRGFCVWLFSGLMLVVSLGAGAVFPDDCNWNCTANDVNLITTWLGDISGAPVDPVGIEEDKSMEIPVDVSRIGWYEYGPAPGAEQGSAVLTAHIDSREQGRGVFYDLDELDAGDTVDISMSDGTTRQFVVDEIRQIPKVELPTGDIFRRDGDHRLALITCGGEFDAESRHYRDNIVVFATPAV